MKTLMPAVGWTPDILRRPLLWGALRERAQKPESGAIRPRFVTYLGQKTTKIRKLAVSRCDALTSTRVG